jgi:hypothetical protein
MLTLWNVHEACKHNITMLVRLSDFCHYHKIHDENTSGRKNLFWLTIAEVTIRCGKEALKHRETYSMVAR